MRGRGVQRKAGEQTYFRSRGSLTSMGVGDGVGGGRVRTGEGVSVTEGVRVAVDEAVAVGVCNDVAESEAVGDGIIEGVEVHVGDMRAVADGVGTVGPTGTSFTQSSRAPGSRARKRTVCVPPDNVYSCTTALTPSQCVTTSQNQLPRMGPANPQLASVPPSIETQKESACQSSPSTRA